MTQEKGLKEILHLVTWLFDYTITEGVKFSIVHSRMIHLTYIFSLDNIASEAIKKTKKV
jgi:hypothetical protein